MGEKIRNLFQSSVDDNDFVIELNEGFKKEDINLIHFHMNKFRCMLNIKEFYSLAATVLRAEAEIKYYKNRKFDNLEIRPRSHQDIMVDTSNIKKILQILELSDGNYRFVDSHKGIIMLLVRKEEKRRLQKLFKAKRIKKISHPYSSNNGYTYLYQMNEPILLKIENVLCEIYFELPCMSLSYKKWIPLSKEIHESLWESPGEFGDNIMCLNSRVGYIYKLTWIIFCRKFLYDDEVAYFEQNQELLKDEKMHFLLETVFFGYTDILIRELENRNYVDLIKKYFSYKSY